MKNDGFAAAFSVGGRQKADVRATTRVAPYIVLDSLRTGWSMADHICVGDEWDLSESGPEDGRSIGWLVQRAQALGVFVGELDKGAS